VNRFDEGDAFGFFYVGLKKSDALFQSLYVVRDAVSGVAAIAHPTAKRPSLVTVIEVIS
jgi:hypothetical protein